MLNHYLKELGRKMRQETERFLNDGLLSDVDPKAELEELVAESDDDPAPQPKDAESVVAASRGQGNSDHGVGNPMDAVRFGPERTFLEDLFARFGLQVLVDHHEKADLSMPYYEYVIARQMRLTSVQTQSVPAKSYKSFQFKIAL